jgi:hypothetical protein
MLRSALSVDANGRSVGDYLAHFAVTDGPNEAESTDDIQYFLAVGADSCWMIRKRTISTGTERFAFGRGDAGTAWTNRASQTYDRPNVIF